MRIARAFILDKGLTTISLGKDITLLDNVRFVDKINLLKNKLAKEEEGIVGIAYFTIGKIVLKNDGTYMCRVFASMETIEGNWTLS